MYVNIYNFQLEADGSIALPSVEIRHPQSNQDRVGLIHFLEAMISSLVNLYGEWIAHLCARKADLGEFSVAVVKIDDELRQKRQGSFAYAVNAGGQWMPMG